MMTKDYIYLGMIVLTALAFYCNGFYAGVYRCKKMYDSLLNDAETESPSEASPELQNDLSEMELGSEDAITTNPSKRDSRLLITSRDVRGNFGKN